MTNGGSRQVSYLRGGIQVGESSIDLDENTTSFDPDSEAKKLVDKVEM